MVKMKWIIKEFWKRTQDTSKDSKVVIGGEFENFSNWGAICMIYLQCSVKINLCFKSLGSNVKRNQKKF